MERGGYKVEIEVSRRSGWRGDGGGWRVSWRCWSLEVRFEGGGCYGGKERPKPYRDVIRQTRALVTRMRAGRAMTGKSDHALVCMVFWRGCTSGRNGCV